MKKLQIIFLILILGIGHLAGSHAADRLTSGDAVVNDNLGPPFPLAEITQSLAFLKTTAKAAPIQVRYIFSSVAQRRGRFKKGSSPAT